MVGYAIEGALSPEASHSRFDVALGVLIPPTMMVLGVLLSSKLVVGIYLYFLHWMLLLVSMRVGKRGIAIGWVVGTVLMVLSLPLVAIELYPSLS